MSKIGEYRLRIYDLLYEKPICEYAETAGSRKISNVLIVGIGWIGNEAFKSAFWAGQALDTTLNITVAAKNASVYKNHILSSEDGSVMPALKTFAEEKNYANLKFVDIDIEHEIVRTELNKLDFAAGRYNYIVISLGNAEHNWLAASEIIPLISEARKYEAKTNNVIINIFDELADDIDSEIQEMLIDEGRSCGIEVHFFGKSTDTHVKLDQIARNINFSYCMKYDQRISKKEADRQFEASRIAEFVESPCEYKTGDTNIAANFIGAKYSADSSYASAVHIPVKLAMCKNSNVRKLPIGTLKNSIRKKNNLYWKLVSLEHRRWNAYMVTRGFRAPSLFEEENFLYHNDNTHLDKHRLLHICLCECGDKATLKNDFDNQYYLWRRKNYPLNDPSELDRASLRVHQLTDMVSNQIDIKGVLRLVAGNNTEYSNLRRSIIKLINDDNNSIVLYKTALIAAKSYADSVSKEEIGKINRVEKMLSPVVIRNGRVDFFGLDEQLIEMIPFALWYENKYETVITISDGMTTSTYDVIIPTLFCAQNAVFIGKTVNSRKYQNAIKNYFKGRGGNTQPSFVELSTINVDTVMNCLERQLKAYEHQSIIINCVPNQGCDVALAIGRLIEKYPESINTVQYSRDKGIVSFSSDKDIGVGLDNKSFSSSEYIKLMGGRIENEYASLYDSKEYESLLSLFKKYSKPLQYSSDTKEGSINTWALITRFVSQSSKDSNFEEKIHKENECAILHYCGVFLQSVFESAHIDEVLNHLQTYHIIRTYDKLAVDNKVTVTFDYINPELGDLLRKFENDQIVDTDYYKALKFIPMSGGLKISNRLVDHTELVSSDETEVHKIVKQEFLLDLLKLKYIENLQINEEDNAVSFAFRDEKTMRLFKTQGLVFELIVYYLMRDSGKYDDVETGVKIAWDAEDTPQEQQLLDELSKYGSGSFGYSKYLEARSKVIRRSALGEELSVKNEIDIVALNGMQPTMVSCKTSDHDSMQWIYEIKAVSDHFQSRGILAVSSDYRDKSRSMFVARANQMDVVLWGTERLWNRNI